MFLISYHLSPHFIVCNQREAIPEAAIEFDVLENPGTVILETSKNFSKKYVKIN